jgi:hypothetical protein
VALFALLMQLGLSFGHVHPIAAGEPTAIANASEPASHPANGGHHDDDYCAICAVLALLSGAQTATAPAIAPPMALASNEITATADTPAAAAAWGAFRSRAPPQS